MQNNSQSYPKIEKLDVEVDPFTGAFKSIADIECKDADDTLVKVHQRYEEVVSWKENFFSATENIQQTRGQKYFCKICTEIFNTRLSILTHSKYHRNFHFCVLCGVYRRSVEEMNIHKKTDHKLLVHCAKKKIFELNDFNNLEVEANGFLIKRLGEDEEESPRKDDIIYEMIQISYPFNEKIESNKTIKSSQNKNYKKPILTSRYGRCITPKNLDL